MFGNAKMWPYYMYNIKSWIFSSGPSLTLDSWPRFDLNA